MLENGHKMRKAVRLGFRPTKNGVCDEASIT
jgi:hypothetical protein